MVASTEISSNINCPRQNDVLSGRGNGVHYHAGNILFRKFVNAYKFEYVTAKRGDKWKYCDFIYDKIKEQDPPGRFLKKKNKELWYELEARKAKEKIAQALREGAPDIKDNIMKPLSTATDQEENIAAVKLPVKGNLPEVTSRSEMVTTKETVDSIDTFSISSSNMSHVNFINSSELKEVLNSNEEISRLEKDGHMPPFEPPYQIKQKVEPYSSTTDCESSKIVNSMLKHESQPRRLSIILNPIESSESMTVTLASLNRMNSLNLDEILNDSLHVESSMSIEKKGCCITTTVSELSADLVTMMSDS